MEQERSLYRVIVDVLRIIVAAAFIFSGFTKAVDPWGTAIKLGEYFTVFSADWLSGSEMFFSILQSTAEMLLGFALFFNIGRRITYTVMVLAMLFFTLLTLVLALTNPVSDCGCFGDAIKLTNWQTFWKNVALLAMSLIVWWSSRKRLPARTTPSLPTRTTPDIQPHTLPGIQPHRTKRRRDAVLLALFTLSGVGLSVYALMYLPPIDFLPFREGTDIVQAMKPQGEATTEAVVVYKNIESGEQREFTLSDTTWQDDTLWEFVETRIETSGDAKPAGITDFAIFNSAGDHTSELLNHQGVTFIVTMTTFDDVSPSCRARVERALDYAAQHGFATIGVTTSPLPAGDRAAVGKHTIDMYNIDGTTLKSLIRARAGMVVLENGTIRAKWSCRGIPDMQKKDKLW